MLKKIRALFDEKMWKFLFVGVLNTIVGWGLQFLMYNLIAGMNELVASAVSYAIASVMSYFLNRYFTFQYQGKGFAVVLRFALNILVCWVIAYGLATPLIRSLLSGQSETVQGNLTLLAGSCMFVGLNYLGQRFFAFREQPKKNTEEPQ